MSSRMPPAQDDDNDYEESLDSILPFLRARVASAPGFGSQLKNSGLSEENHGEGEAKMKLGIDASSQPVSLVSAMLAKKNEGRADASLPVDSAKTQKSELVKDRDDLDLMEIVAVRCRGVASLDTCDDYSKVAIEEEREKLPVPEHPCIPVGIPIQPGEQELQKGQDNLHVPEQDKNRQAYVPVGVPMQDRKQKLQQEQQQPQPTRQQPGAYAARGSLTRSLSLDDPQPLAQAIVSALDTGAIGNDSSIDRSVMMDDFNSGLVQANPVVEDLENPPTATVARPVDVGAEEAKEAERKQQRGCLLVVILLAVVVMAISIGVITNNKKKSAASRGQALGAPSMPPTGSPSAAPSMLLDALLEGLPGYTAASLQNRTSPQSKAYSWLQTHKNITNIKEWKKRQLFALASFYFAMDGPNWPSEISSHWMDDEKDECFWFSSYYGGFNEEREYSHELSTIEAEPCDTNGNFQALILAGLGLSSDYGATIPPEIALLESLEILALPQNNFSQSLADLIPSTLYQMTTLTKVNFHGNDLSGSMPTELGLLTRLRGIDLGENQLYGSIVTELGLISTMEHLSLHGTELEGEIPSEIGRCKAMIGLYLGETGLYGQLPSELGLLSNVEELGVWETGLSGTIPTEFGQLTTITGLILGGCNNTGHLPSELGLLSNMEALELWENDFSGTLPSEIGGWGSVSYLDVGGNSFTGLLPSELGLLFNLEELFLWENNVSGSLPSELGKLTAISFLDLGGNAISGHLPKELGLLSNMESLALWENSVSGALPSEFGQLKAITYLELGGNNLTGTFPSELGGLSDLESLALWENNVSGTIPSEFGQMAAIHHLDLGGNAVTGQLPSELALLIDLEEFFLWGNNVNGTIPNEFGGLGNLRFLSLVDNSLSGTIPLDLELLLNTNQGSLKLLQLEMNLLSGMLPDELCELGEFDLETMVGLTFDCSTTGLCGCPWCPCK